MSRKPKCIRYIICIPSSSSDVVTYRLRAELSPSSVDYFHKYYDLGLGRFHPPTGKIKFDLYKVEGLSDLPSGAYDIGVTSVDFHGNESNFQYKYVVDFNFKSFKYRTLHGLYSALGIIV